MAGMRVAVGDMASMLLLGEGKHIELGSGSLNEVKETWWLLPL